MNRLEMTRSAKSPMSMRKSERAKEPKPERKKRGWMPRRIRQVGAPPIVLPETDEGLAEWVLERVRRKMLEVPIDKPADRRNVFDSEIGRSLLWRRGFAESIALNCVGEECVARSARHMRCFWVAMQSFRFLMRRRRLTQRVMELAVALGRKGDSSVTPR